MPTLTVGGRSVQVGDAFLSLSPEQQNATVDEIAKSLGIAAPPAEPPAKSSVLPEAGKFALTSVVRGLGGLADFAMDPLAPLRRLVSPALENIERSGKFRPGEAAGNAFFGATGIPEYQPETPYGRIGLAATEGLVAGGPFGLAPALLSGLGGALSQGTMEATGSERLSTAAGLLPMGLAPVGRGAINYATGLGKQTLGPALSQGYREGIVGDQLRTAASDPLALSQSLREPMVPELVPGSKPTTFQYTADPGIGQLERAMRTSNAAPFLERMQGQSKARISEIQGLAPETASPGAVRDVLRQQMARLDAEGEAQVAAARQNAIQAFDQAGGRLAPEQIGTLMREQMEAAKKIAKAQESKLWQAIDPEGNLTINGLSVRQEASKIASEIPKTAKPPEGEEAAVLSHARLLGTASPFSDFTALRSRLLSAIREERVNGETPALRRMQMLRSAMDDAIENAAENAAQRNPDLFGRLAADYDEVGLRVGDEAAAGRDAETRSVVVPGGSSVTSSGSFGTAGQTARGSRSAARNQGIQEPPRPKDLIKFLIDLGGIKDASGELRAQDFHKVGPGYFGRLSRKNGMELDYAREAAVEAGYLHRDADINDLLNALRRNQQGNPVFIESDPAAIEWRAWDRAQRRGDFEKDVPLPGDITPPPSTPSRAPAATFDEAAAARYREAAAATRERATLFKNREVGPALQMRGNEYRMRDSALPERFLASPEGIKSFIDAGGNPAALKEALAADLRRTATTPDGTLNPAKYASWQIRRDAALRAFPDLQQTLGNAANAQAAVDAVAAASRQRKVEFETGAARHFLNAEPVQAVQAALNGRNPVGDMAQLMRTIGKDADAKAGLQRAVAEHIERQYIGNADALKSDAFQTFINRSGPALSQVFTPQQMQAMRNIAADLKRSNLSIAGSKIPGQSNTMQDLMLSQNRLSVLSGYAGPAAFGIGGGLLAYFMPGGIGFIEGALGAGGAKRVIDNIKAAGVAKTDALLVEALLNPEIASTLLMKANPANRPFIAAKMNSALGRILGGGAVSETKKPQKRAASR